MKSSRAAIRYAKALVQESIDKKCLEQVYLDMKIISNTFNQNDDLKFLVESRVVKNSLKLSTLKLIFKNITKLSLKFTFCIRKIQASAISSDHKNSLLGFPVPHISTVFLLIPYAESKIEISIFVDSSV